MKLRYWFKKHPKLLSRSFAAAVALLVIFVGNLWFEAERQKEIAIIAQRNEQAAKEQAIAARKEELVARQAALAAQKEEQTAKDGALSALNKALEESAILKQRQAAQNGDKPVASEPVPK